MREHRGFNGVASAWAMSRPRCVLSGTATDAANEGANRLSESGGRLLRQSSGSSSRDALTPSPRAILSMFWRVMFVSLRFDPPGRAKPLRLTARQESHRWKLLSTALPAASVRARQPPLVFRVGSRFAWAVRVGGNRRNCASRSRGAIAMTAVLSRALLFRRGLSLVSSASCASGAPDPGGRVESRPTASSARHEPRGPLPARGLGCADPSGRFRDRLAEEELSTRAQTIA